MAAAGVGLLRSLSNYMHWKRRNTLVPVSEDYITDVVQAATRRVSLTTPQIIMEGRIMAQPWEGYRRDNYLRFSAADYLVRLCGGRATKSEIAERWHSEYRATFHEAIWRAHRDKLTSLQARGLDLIVTTLPDIGRGDFMNRLIPLVGGGGTRTPAQIVHEEMEPIILGPYVESGH